MLVYVNRNGCVLTKVLCFSKYELYMLYSIVAKSLLQEYYVFSLIKIGEFWGKIYNCELFFIGTHPIAGEKGGQTS